MRPTHNKVIFFFLVLALIFIFFYAQGIQAAFLQLFRGVNINRGLIGYWSFNNIDIQGATVFDGSGNKRNGTLTGGPTTGITGMFGSAINFDGSDDYIDISPVPTVTGNASISFWMNADAISSTLVNLYFVNSGSEDADNFVIGTFQSKIMATADNNSSFSVQSSALSSATWYHVVVTKTAGDITDVYINGVKDTNASSNFWGGATARGIIGGTWNGGSIGAPWKGKLDEVRVYNRILSDSEVKYLYDHDPIGAAYQSKAIIPNNNGLLAYWNFDDCDSCTRALDRSGNHFDETMYTTCATVAGDLHGNGKINKGASFDASDDCLDSAKIPVVTGNASVSLWFYGKTVTGQRELFNFVNSGSENVDYFNVGTFQSRILACGDNQTSSCKSSPSSPTLSPNTWYHLVVTKAAGSASSVYLNGVDVTTDGHDNLDGGTAAARIGNGFFANQSWDGYIDEVRVYNRILTAAEVQNLYKETRRLYVTNDPYATAILRLAPVSYWRLNEREGTIVNDQGLLNIKGTYVNTPTLNLRGFLRASNQAAQFPSTANAHVAFGYRPQLDLSSFSVTAWIKAANLDQYSAIVYHMDDAAGQGWGAQLVSSTGLTELCTGSGGSANCVRNTSAIVAGNTWYFIAFTVTGTTGKSYFNGSLETTNGSQVAPAYPSDVRTWIARRNGSELSFLNNDNLTVDEVAIFNYVLTDTQITNLYNIGRAN